MTSTLHRPPCVSYIDDADLGELEVWWTNCGDLIDFAMGWTFLVEIGQRWQPAVISKTTGVTGGTGSGTEDNGVPNLVIEWDLGELDVLTPGEWVIEITATRDADLKERKRQIRLTIIPEVLALVP